MTNLEFFYAFAERLRIHMSAKGRTEANSCNKDVEIEDKGEYLIVSFVSYRSGHEEAVKKHIEQVGWKKYSSEEKDTLINISLGLPEDHKEKEQSGDCKFFESHKQFCNCYTSYFRVIYNKASDKVAVGQHMRGYGYAFKKDRLYPIAKSTPLLTKTDKFWYFRYNKKKFAVRELMLSHYLPDIISKSLHDVLGFEEQDDLPPFFGGFSEDEGRLPPLLLRQYLVDRNMINTIERCCKTTLPKALKKYMNIDSLFQIAKIIVPNDYNRLCQVLSTMLAADREKYPNTDYDNLYCLDKLLLKVYNIPELGTYLLRDVINEHVYLNKKISLKIKAMARIQEEHRRNSRILRERYKGPVKTQKKYHKVLKDFKGEYEFINTRKRLTEEGTIQDYCVAGYGDNINSGRCAIFSIMWKGLRYTLEVRHRGDEKFYSDFYIGQLQGHANGRTYGPPPQDLYDALRTECNLETEHCRTLRLDLGNQTAIAEANRNIGPVLDEVAF